MKKKILSVILCVVMLASTLAVTVGATTVNDTAAVWNTKSSASFNVNLDPKTGRHIMFCLADENSPISETSTVTFWIKPNNWSEKQGGTSFYLVGGDIFTPKDSGGVGDFSYDKSTNLMTGIQANIYGGLGLRLGLDANYSDNNVSSVDYTMTDSAWNRIDMMLDFDTKQMTAYLNYKSMGVVDFANKELDGFVGLYMPSLSNKYKVAFMDNIMVREGLCTPAKGDVAANPTGVVVGQNGIIMYQNFDGTFCYDGAHAGDVCCGPATVTSNGQQVYWHSDMNKSTTEGIVSQAQGAVNRGYQQSVAVADATDNKTKYNTRFVATLDDYTKYDEIGFQLTVNGKESYVPCGAVYDSVTGGFEITETYSALGSFGAGYIYCLTVTGMVEGESYTVEVAPYTVAKDATKKTVGASYTVTLTAGASAQ